MRRIISVSILLLCLTAFCGCASQGTHVGMAAEQVAVKKAMRTLALDNGVTLIVKESGPGTPTAVQVWLTDGSMSDPQDKPGLAHFVEHMLFTGSLHVPAGKAVVYLEGMGGKMAGHTGRDFSYIGVTMPGRGWERALDILFDTVAYPSFRPEQVERQRGVIVQEIARQYGEPDSLLIDNLFGEAYRSHPYRNPVAGTVKTVSGLKRDDMAGYYSRVYVPSNMVVVVVGDVKANAVKAAVAKTFGHLAPVPFKEPFVEAETSQPFTRTKSVDGPVRLTYMAMGWHVCAACSPDIYPVEVLRAVLGQGRGSRLSMDLMERSGAAYDVEATLFPMKAPGLLVVSAHLRGDGVGKVAAETLRQINKLKEEPVSGAELDRAVANIEATHMLDTETSEGQAYALGYWATVYGGSDPTLYMRNIRKVTPEDIRRVAQKYLGEGNYTLSVIRPGGGQ